MKKISRVFLFGALVLILITTACTAEGIPIVVITGSPSPDNTVTAGTETTTRGDITLTPSIPVTGADVILLECQFCVDQVAQALLVMPETTTFEVSNATASLSTTDPEMGCNTVDTFNNRQVVLCRAPEDSSITLNLCTDANTCTELLVTFQTCPDVANTLQSSNPTSMPQPVNPTNTTQPGNATSTPAPATSPTPVNTPTPAASPTQVASPTTPAITSYP